MTLAELDTEFKKATRITFNINIPLIQVHFDSDMQANAFYSELWLYFEDHLLGVILEISKSFDLTIFSSTNGESIRNESLRCVDDIGFNNFITSPFKNDKILFGCGYIHYPSKASMSLFMNQFETPILFQKLAFNV